MLVARQVLQRGSAPGRVRSGGRIHFNRDRRRLAACRPVPIRLPPAFSTGPRRRRREHREGTFISSAHQDLQERRPGAQGHRPDGRGGRFLRAAGAERRRQNHRDRHRHFAGQQDRRQGRGVRSRHRPRAGGGEVLHRAGAAGDQLQPVRDREHDPGQPGRVLRHPAPRRARPRWRNTSARCSSGKSATPFRARCPAA